MIGQSRSLKFTATIHKVGINPSVNVPEKISRVLERTGNIPVRGTVNGFAFRSTLVPVKGGPYRLYLNSGMQKGADIGVGNIVEVLLEYDPDPRVDPIPDLLLEEFNRNPGAMSTWNALVPSRRKEILRYLNSLKSHDALARNVRKVIGMLAEKQDSL